MNRYAVSRLSKSPGTINRSFSGMNSRSALADPEAVVFRISVSEPSFVTWKTRPPKAEMM